MGDKIVSYLDNLVPMVSISGQICLKNYRCIMLPFMLNMFSSCTYMPICIFEDMWIIVRFIYLWKDDWGVSSPYDWDWMILIKAYVCEFLLFQTEHTLLYSVF